MDISTNAGELMHMSVWQKSKLTDYLFVFSMSDLTENHRSNPLILATQQIAL
jgi:hypothetical protein